MFSPTPPPPHACSLPTPSPTPISSFVTSGLCLLCVKCFRMTVGMLCLLPFSVQLFVFFVIVPPPPFLCRACRVSVPNESPDSVLVVSMLFQLLRCIRFCSFPCLTEVSPKKPPYLLWPGPLTLRHTCYSGVCLSAVLGILIRSPVCHIIYIFGGWGGLATSFGGSTFPQYLSKKRIYGTQNIWVLPWLSKSLF